jgi:hypothetical protein
MCKLLFFSKIKGLEIEKKLTPILKVMERGNKDGIGIFSESGYIKSLSLESLFYENAGPDFCENYIESISSGDFLKGTSLAIHSRTSTNYIGVDYSHPFKVGDNNFFAHNGVVDILENNYVLETKNDSEFLANYYFEKGRESLSNISGYFAYIALNSKIWTIGRDEMAELYCGKIVENDSYIFSTKKEDILEITKILSVTLKFLKRVKDYTEITFKNGLVVSQDKIPKKINIRVKDNLYNISMGKSENSGVFNSSDRFEDSYEGFSNSVYSSGISAELFDLGFDDGVEAADAKMGVVFDNRYEDNADYLEGFSEGYYSEKNSSNLVGR